MNAFDTNMIDEILLAKNDKEINAKIYAVLYSLFDARLDMNHYLN